MPAPAFIWTRPGHWLYQLWHRPKASLERSAREGGPFEQWKTHRARVEMQVAAARLAPLAVRAPRSDEPCLFFLTGNDYWEQLAFCLRSLQLQTPGQTWPVVVVDDDTLQPAQWASLAAAFPGLSLVAGENLRQSLDTRLPRARFPVLRAHREHFALLRKLTDVHAARPGANLFLDADMLFHRRPAALLAWFDDPSQPLVMTDLAESYGYSRAQLSAVSSTSIPSLVNTGVCGLVSTRIDWTEVERWTRTLLDTCGSHYFLEQALVALLLGDAPFRQLPANDYIVAPPSAEILAPRACLHHYVALSKRDYFRHGWRRFAAPLPVPPRHI